MTNTSENPLLVTHHSNAQGLLSGRLLDQDGVPIPNTLVSLSAQHVRDGDPSWRGDDR